MKNKGITLIALIITIIVMLILVAVSVNILIKSNLIGATEKATDKYKTALEEEANGETIEIGGKKYNSLEDYLKEKGMIEEVHDWKRTGDNLTCNHCNVTLTIGQEINYTDTGKKSSIIVKEKSGSSEQTISKDSNTKWVVLGAEDSNNNGTNETLLITTQTPTTGKIVLYGAAGYNNCIEEINRMCKELYGEAARGMTIDDVNNCLQYTPVGGMYFYSTSYKQTNNLTTKLSDLPTWNAIKGDHKTPDGKDTEENFGKVLLNGYYYSVSNDGTYLVNDANTSDTSNTITTATKDVIFGASKDNRYWLASRGVCANLFCAYFGPGAVEGGIASSYIILFDSSGDESDVKLSLRAVVSLRSDIPSVIE